MTIEMRDVNARLLASLRTIGETWTVQNKSATRWLNVEHGDNFPINSAIKRLLFEMIGKGTVPNLIAQDVGEETWISAPLVGDLDQARRNALVREFLGELLPACDLTVEQFEVVWDGICKAHGQVDSITLVFHDGVEYCNPDQVPDILLMNTGSSETTSLLLDVGRPEGSLAIDRFLGGNEQQLGAGRAPAPQDAM